MSLLLAHAADLHLGYRAYDRVDAQGVNRRELDVEQTFVRLVDAMIALAPDVIVIAGDVVHTPRPDNRTVVTLLRECGRLRAALPDAPIVMAAGNHDLSRTLDAVCILDVLTGLDVHVATREAKRVYFPDAALSVLAVPDAPGVTRPVLAPDPRARYNVLCIHGEASAATQISAAHRSTSEISDAELNAPAWSYVAMGHYHQYESLAPNVCYSGAIDYTSSDPWKEIGVPKGFVERDLETGEQAFHALPPSRRYVDLPAIEGGELSPAEIDARLAESIEGAAIDDAVVRLVVTNVTRETGAALDQQAIRRWKRRALHLHLDLRRPARVARDLAASGGAALRQRSLPEIVADRLAGVPGIDGETLRAKALEYLGLAMEHGRPAADAAAQEAA